MNDVDAHTYSFGQLGEILEDLESLIILSFCAVQPLAMKSMVRFPLLATSLMMTTHPIVQATLLIPDLGEWNSCAEAYLLW